MIARRWNCRPDEVDLDDGEAIIELDLMRVEHEASEYLERQERAKRMGIELAKQAGNG